MAIKRYDLHEFEPVLEEVLQGHLVYFEDHIDSHRFDEDAERVKFERHYNYMNLKRDSGYPEFYEDKCANKFWDGWLVCALAREKEFVG